MKKKIKNLMLLTSIILFVFCILDNFGIPFYNDFLFKYFGNRFDYLNINNKEKYPININKIFNINDIANLEYKTLYYKNDDTIKLNKSQENSSQKLDSSTIVNEEPTINEQKNTKPLVYIYNTHNKEEYSKDKNSPHNITPTVVTVSYMLKEQLEKYGIYSIVEERSVAEILNKRKWNYASSYKVTKDFLIDSKKNNSSLKFFIDVHRDSVKKSITTININGKDYAKIMFVLGLENENYNKNLKMMKYLNDKIKKDYPGLTRGIYKKKGKGVNGVYNQDFSENCILIEFGGKGNSLEEVYNTTLVVSKYLSLYIGDYNEN